MDHFSTVDQPFTSAAVTAPEIDQAQLKNLNHDVLLSMWLISMEICPKGTFISIWHLPPQREHKNKLPLHSEPCQISKMKLFANILNDFTYQILSLLSKIIYIDVYSESSSQKDAS